MGCVEWQQRWINLNTRCRGLLLEKEVRPNLETVSNNAGKCYLSQRRVIDQGIEIEMNKIHVH